MQTIQTDTATGLISFVQKEKNALFGYMQGPPGKY